MFGYIPNMKIQYYFKWTYYKLSIIVQKYTDYPYKIYLLIKNICFNTFVLYSALNIYIIFIIICNAHFNRVKPKRFIGREELKIYIY